MGSSQVWDYINLYHVHEWWINSAYSKQNNLQRFIKTGYSETNQKAKRCLDNKDSP